MTSQIREKTSLIHIALFASCDLEDEGLTQVISEQADMDCCCHYVVHEWQDTWPLNQCEWEQVEVAIVMLPFRTLEAVAQTLQENFSELRVVAIMKESWHWSRIAQILNYGVVGLTSAMNSPAIVSMVRLAYYHTGGVDKGTVERLLGALEEDDDVNKIRLKPLDYLVWGLMAEGRSNPEIAQYCDMSISHTKRCVNRIFRYLGVHDRAHAIARYEDCGRKESYDRISREPLECDQTHHLDEMHNSE